MKKGEKRLILILLIILVIVIIIAIVKNSSSSNEDSEVASSSSATEDEETAIESGSEYVEVLDNGTRLNVSEKLNETKTIGGLEVSDIQLTESDNQTVLLATVTNTSSETDGGYIATLTLVDENGEALVELKAYIPELAAGESTQLNTSAGFDYSAAYDFTISK